ASAPLTPVLSRASDRTASCTAPSAHHLALFLTMVHLHLLVDFHLPVYTQMLGWRHAGPRARVSRGRGRPRPTPPPFAATSASSSRSGWRPGAGRSAHHPQE